MLQDVAVAATNIAVGFVLMTTTGVATELWWVGVAAAAVFAALTMASDRSRKGVWLLGASGAALIVAIAAGLFTDTVPFSVLPILLVGLGVGFLCVRVAFGVLRPIPEVRRRRAE